MTNTTDETIEKAKAEFIRARDRMAHLFAAIPDDKVNWSPSPNSRTPAQIVAHSAASIQNLHRMMQGIEFGPSNPVDAEKQFRSWEVQFTTREAANQVLQENGAAYLAFLDSLTPEQLNRLVTLPFGMGQAPLSLMITFPPLHTMGHSSQLEYVQTIYGDLDWHMG